MKINSTSAMDRKAMNFITLSTIQSDKRNCFCRIKSASSFFFSGIAFDGRTVYLDEVEVLGVYYETERYSSFRALRV